MKMQRKNHEIFTVQLSSETQVAFGNFMENFGTTFIFGQ